MKDGTIKDAKCEKNHMPSDDAKDTHRWSFLGDIFDHVAQNSLFLGSSIPSNQNQSRQLRNEAIEDP